MYGGVHCGDLYLGGGRLKAACRNFITWGKPMLVLHHPANAHLVEMGVNWL